MHSAYLGAFTGRLEISNNPGVHISALFDEEVGDTTHRELKDFFSAERGDELRLDYAIVSVVVKSIFSVGKYRASINILNIAVT